MHQENQEEQESPSPQTNSQDLAEVSHSGSGMIDSVPVPRSNSGTVPRSNSGTVPRSNSGTVPRSNSGNIPWLDLPTKSLDQWATYVRMPSTNNVPPTPYLFLDDMSLSEQATWVMPAMPDMNKLPAFATPVWATESYSHQISALLKRSGIYALSSLATPLVALVLAPFLTHYLTHSDYGALSVLNTAIALGAGLTQLGLASAFFRAYNFDYDTHKEKMGVLSTVLNLLTLVLVPTTLLIMLCAPWLASLLLQDGQLSETVRVAGLVILCQNLTVPGFAWMRAENRAFQFVLLSITNLLINLVATIVLVGVWHMGIVGSLLAIAGGYGVVAICTLPQILWHAGIRLHIPIAKGLLVFGLPNVVNFFSVWVLQLADRYMLSRLGSLSQTAMYTVAYNLGGVLGVLVISPFLLAWPSVLFTLAKRKDARRIFQLIFRWYFIILLIAAYALSLVGMALLQLFFPPAYRAAAPVIPIIALSILFYGLYNYITLGVGLKRKTWLAVIFTSSAALLNVGLNCYLIPLYGSMGAALATLIAYVVLVVIAYIVNQRLYPVPYEIGKFVCALFIGLACFLGSSYLVQFQVPLLAWGISFGGLCLYTGYLLVLGNTRYLRKRSKNV
ncbi:MAG TPA: polysaccharide biosynthesis C-terminal domain-containing protein [Ktedonobacteraceae bacterium]